MIEYRGDKNREFKKQRKLRLFSLALWFVMSFFMIAAIAISWFGYNWLNLAIYCAIAGSLTGIVFCIVKTKEVSTVETIEKLKEALLWSFLIIVFSMFNVILLIMMRIIER